jgi:signal transduction histidine kinase
MRAMVGVLREGAEPDLAPHPGLSDLERLARHVGDAPRVDVELSGDLADVHPTVGAALYRIAQESVTNALRHARHATRVLVAVSDEGEQVRLTVRDDGDARVTASTAAGYGLVGMAERASLFDGTFQAGPDPDRGWSVDVVLPKGVTTT